MESEAGLSVVGDALSVSGDCPQGPGQSCLELRHQRLRAGHAVEGVNDRVPALPVAMTKHPAEAI